MFAQFLSLFRRLFHNRSAWLEHTVSVFVLLLLTTFIFWKHLTGKTFFTFDFPQAYYAMNAYWISSLQAGEWPHWIPYQSMGYPALMNPQLGIFYPPFWIFVLLRIPYTMHAATVFQIAHILFGGIGLYVLANRLSLSRLAALCGGVAFICFGGFYSNAEHPDIIRTFAWVPWLLQAAVWIQRERPVTFMWRCWRTRLTWHNLLLPVFVFAFIAGSYPGGMIAGLLLLTIFVFVQATTAAVETRSANAWWDGAFETGLIAIGVGMASLYLVPTAYLTREITRASGFGSLPVMAVSGHELLNAFFPSGMLKHADYSMYGMQLPIVLYIFCTLINRRRLVRLIPFFALAGFACVMCIQSFHRIAEFIIKLCPPLGLSRFPAGDYRVYISLSILLVSLEGLNEALARKLKWRSIALLLAGVVTFNLIAAEVVQSGAAANPEELMRFCLSASIAALGAIILIAIGHSYIRILRVAPYLVPILIFVCILPVLYNMRPYWSDPDMMRGTYDSQGLPLKSHGHLRAKEIFNKVESSRPARQTPARLMALSWRGYIDGSYMTGDLGGMRSVAASAVDRDPGLQTLMQKPSTILSVECSVNPTVCTGTNPMVRLSPELSAGRATQYSRNSVEYDVQLQTSALLVENEIYAPGWHGICETHGQQLQCKRVNGALRGWVLPAGHHHIRLWYFTPRLHLGIALTCIAFLTWIGLLANLVWANSSGRVNEPLGEVMTRGDSAA